MSTSLNYLNTEIEILMYFSDKLKWHHSSTTAVVGVLQANQLCY